MFSDLAWQMICQKRPRGIDLLKRLIKQPIVRRLNPLITRWLNGLGRFGVVSLIHTTNCTRNKSDDVILAELCDRSGRAILAIYIQKVDGLPYTYNALSQWSSVCGQKKLVA